MGEEKGKRRNCTSGVQSKFTLNGEKRDASKDRNHYKERKTWKRKRVKS